MRPNKIHFITGLKKDFGGKPFILPHLIAILSARCAYPDHDIFVHYQYQPSGQYWDIAKDFVTECHVLAPTEIFGRPIAHFAHATDVVRLNILIAHGGLYFDMDTLIYSSINHLPTGIVVMGVESDNDSQIHGLCNAFIAAPAQAPFLLEWLNSFRDFDGSDWNRHAVRRPFELAQKFPHFIHIQPRKSFFYPHWSSSELENIFVNNVDVSASYSIHLWESLSWNYLSCLTLDSIERGHATYHRRAREVLAAFPSVVSAIKRTDMMSAANITQSFEAAYHDRRWGDGSGSGSIYSNNIEYCSFISRFMNRNNVKSVLDLGCGDWQFSQYMNWTGVHYHGVDAVPELVRRNTELYGAEAVQFSIFSDWNALPAADLLLCKDVMQHWPNKMVIDFFNAVSRKYRYILITNDEEPFELQNQDIPLAGWRTLDVRRPPFNQRAATVFSWYAPGVRKSTMLLLDDVSAEK